MARNILLTVGNKQQPPDGITVPAVFTGGPSVAVWLEQIKKLDETDAGLTGITIEQDSAGVHYVVAHMKWD